MTEYKIIGIDLAKTNFHLAALDCDHKLILKKALHRDEVLSYVAATFPKGSIIAMEACGGCHFWGQNFESLGFPVILLKPKDVKPYAKAKQKNDMNDALAICKAALDPELKHVHLKSQQEQTVAYLHKSRQNVIRQRIQRSNSILTSLMEFGVVVKCRKSAFGKEAEKHIFHAFWSNRRVCFAWSTNVHTWVVWPLRLVKYIGKVLFPIFTKEQVMMR